MTLINESGYLKEDLKLPEEEWLKDVSDNSRQIPDAASNEYLV